ncbi:hypothetical protein JMJ77_0002353 [Colletotrichum scovillei]|uniref:Uncharacterized protein n=1 Tax=Colletotrichum scovillei TaxID=1209932 RepID=A0A9P7R7S9_9PEZI|nr:hypothetical protein JMJ77_0002353 [Colletotrichum scovillei]KAG7070772.1 hypothetical protein JMJ76_0002018 [Colletotrichum scovillei]KAG7079008.1 hypothetical protein JMJ78_0002670 [Colletotrichum scovillei]
MSSGSTTLSTVLFALRPHNQAFLHNPCRHAIPLTFELPVNVMASPSINYTSLSADAVAAARPPSPFLLARESLALHCKSSLMDVNGGLAPPSTRTGARPSSMHMAIPSSSGLDSRIGRETIVCVRSLNIVR